MNKARLSLSHDQPHPRRPAGHLPGEFGDPGAANGQATWDSSWRMTRGAILWLRLVNVADALSRRRYQVEGRLVLHVSDTLCPWNTGSWLLTGGPGGAECHRTSAVSDAGLALDASTLASMYLGGTSIAHLASARRIAGPRVRSWLIECTGRTVLLRLLWRAPMSSWRSWTSRSDPTCK